MGDLLERQLLRLYESAPLSTQAYIRIRLRNFPKAPISEILQSLTERVVSLGAGYGVYEILAALSNPAAHFIATDIDEKRIRLAQEAAADLPNLEFHVLDLKRDFAFGRVGTFLLFDVLHHLDPGTQVRLLETVSAQLDSGGRVIVKECGTRPTWKCWVNYLNDAIGSPFQPTHPRSEQEWSAILQEFGLKTSTQRLDRGSPYAHILVIGTKPAPCH